MEKRLFRSSDHLQGPAVQHMARGSMLCGRLGGRGVWVRFVPSRAVKSDSASTWTAACRAPLSMDDSLGKNTGVGCHALLQGIVPTRGSGIKPRSPTLQVHPLSSEPPGPWGEMDACMCMAGSLRCLPETTTALLIGYTPIQNNKFKVWTK